jgi:hypothetical protein
LIQPVNSIHRVQNNAQRSPQANKKNVPQPNGFAEILVQSQMQAAYELKNNRPVPKKKR